MKKKLFLVLLSIAMVVTMLPLAVFAGASNEEHKTPIGDTNLSLVGDREAIPSSGDKKNDFRISEGDNIIDIYTSGWTLVGEDTKYDIIFNVNEGGSGNITFGEGLHILSFDSEKASCEITIESKTQIDKLFSANGATFTGNGRLDITDGRFMVGQGQMNQVLCTIDGPTINVNKSTNDEIAYTAVFLGDFELRSGKFIVENNVEGTSGEGIPCMAFTCMGNTKIANDAELFVNSKQISVVVMDPSGLKARGVLVDKEQKSYQEKDTVVSKGYEVEQDFYGSKVYGFAIDEDGKEPAKTVRTATGEEPENLHEVTYMDGDEVYTTQTVADGYCAKMPVDPEKDNYKFTGWYLDKEAKEKYDFETPVTADLTLYAGWEETSTPTPTPTPNPNNNTTKNNGARGVYAKGGVTTSDTSAPIVLTTIGILAVGAVFAASRKLRNK